MSATGVHRSGNVGFYNPNGSDNKGALSEAINDAVNTKAIQIFATYILFSSPKGNVVMFNSEKATSIPVGYHKMPCDNNLFSMMHTNYTSILSQHLEVERQKAEKLRGIEIGRKMQEDGKKGLDAALALKQSGTDLKKSGLALIAEGERMKAEGLREKAEAQRQKAEAQREKAEFRAKYEKADAEEKALVEKLAQLRLKKAAAKNASNKVDANNKASAKTASSVACTKTGSPPKPAPTVTSIPSPSSKANK